MECVIIKNRRTVLLTALLLLFLTTAPAQIVLNTADIPGIKIIRCDTVHGKALWGLIDGGADIYFEYGFSNVTVQEVLRNNFRFKFEVYTMENDEAAFGIFTVSHFKCNSDTLAGWCCVSPYQIQSAQGRFYVSVVNDSGTSAEQEFSRQITAKILEKTGGKDLSLPSVFYDPLFLPHVSKIKFVSGPLGVQNGFPSWEEKFRSIEKFKAYILPIESDSGSTVVSVIRFGKAGDVDQFSRNMVPAEPASSVSDIDKSKIPKRYLKKTNPTEVIYFETDLPYGYFMEYIKAVESLE